jgi:isopentenyl-diphosphate delta-isomerase
VLFRSESVRWSSLEEIAQEMAHNPEHFTAWFRIIFNEYRNRLSL